MALILLDSSYLSSVDLYRIMINLLEVFDEALGIRFFFIYVQVTASLISVCNINGAYAKYVAKRRRTIVRGITYLQISSYFKFRRAAKYKNYYIVPFCKNLKLLVERENKKKKQCVRRN